MITEPSGSRPVSRSISYGFSRSPVGECLLATTAMGICWLDLAPDENSLSLLSKTWQTQRLERDDDMAATLTDSVFDDESDKQIVMHVRGTDFQLRVWHALLRIKPGHCMSYGQIARCIGAPRAARAVGSAIGANSIGAMIPCHRVLPETGVLGAYRWGSELKLALLLHEKKDSHGSV